MGRSARKASKALKGGLDAGEAKPAPAGTRPIPVAKGFESIGVPEGHTGGLRTDVSRPWQEGDGATWDAVLVGADAKSKSLQSAIANYEATLAKHLENGVPPNVAARAAESELEDAASLVRQHVPAKDDPAGTVTADMAMALLRLPPATRSMILRRAGNPEIFQNLEDAFLDAGPETLAQRLQKSVAAQSGAAMEKQAEAANVAKPLTKEQTPSSYLRQEGKVSKRTGKPLKPSETYKNYLPDTQSADDVDTTVLAATRELLGDEAARAIPLTSKQQELRGRLAGDLEAERIAALRKVLVEQFGVDESGRLPPELYRTLVDLKLLDDPALGDERLDDIALRQSARDSKLLTTGKGEVASARLLDALVDNNVLPEVVPYQRGAGGKQENAIRKAAEIEVLELAKIPGAKKMNADQRLSALSENAGLLDRVERITQSRMPARSNVIYKNTGFSDSFYGGRGGPSVDDVADQRQRSQASKIEEMLYQLTAHRPDVDPSTGAVRVDHNGNPIGIPDSSTVLDIDRYFPILRGQFGEPTPDGQVVFKAKSKDPLWATNFIKGLLGNQDPDFVRRMLPLVERSLAAMPDSPTQTLTQQGVVGAGEGSRAAKLQNEVFYPSPSFKKAVMSGEASGRIYGDRDISVPDTAAIPATGADDSVTLDHATDEDRQFLQGLLDTVSPQQTPGKTDTSSIYRSSPIRALLA